MTDPAREAVQAARLAREAVRLGRDDAGPLCRAGHALAYVVHEFDEAAFSIDRALALNPNLASAWFSSGWLRVWIGEPEAAVKHFAQFIRISPLDPQMSLAQSGSAFAHFLSGRYEEALPLAEQALKESPDLLPALRVSALINAVAGRIEQAQKTMARLREIDPAFGLKHQAPFRRPQDSARYAEAMRLAALPE